MAFKIEISTTNADFEENPGEAVANILESVAGKLRDGYSEDIARDANGNRVGSWTLSGK